MNSQNLFRDSKNLNVSYSRLTDNVILINDDISHANLKFTCIMPEQNVSQPKLITKILRYVILIVDKNLPN